MSADLVCVKSIHNKCACPKCKEVKDHKDAVEFYRKDLCKEAAHSEEFPEREKNEY